MAGLEREDCGGISVLRANANAPGTLLVLLHGIGSNAASFAPLMGELDRPAIAWDAPGYGGSASLGMEWPSASDYASTLARLLDGIGAGGSKIDVLGHSLGALIAGRFAVLHSHRVRRLILASPALGYGTAPGQPLAAPAASRLDAFLAEGGAQFAATRGPRLVHSRKNTALVAAVVEAMSQVKLPGYAQASRMLSCADLGADGARITTPTLVMVGSEDEITPPPRCRALYDAMAAAQPALGHRWEEIAAAGHAVTQERPDAVARLIEAFAPATGEARTTAAC